MASSGSFPSILMDNKGEYLSDNESDGEDFTSPGSTSFLRHSMSLPDLSVRDREMPASSSPRSNLRSSREIPVLMMEEDLRLSGAYPPPNNEQPDSGDQGDAANPDSGDT